MTPVPSGVHAVKLMFANSARRTRSLPLSGSTVTSVDWNFEYCCTAAAIVRPSGDHDGDPKNTGTNLSGQCFVTIGRMLVPSALGTKSGERAGCTGWLG